ncbi:MAG: sodium:calcium antiporter [Hyphomicrobiales bacterium]|nr:sodium:calcium antiporter [Hyphomicrobiales bacterium]
MNAADFLANPLWLNFAVFAVAAASVWWAGTRLAIYADAIADMTGLGSAFIGMIMLGGITSLPEIAVSITAGYSGEAALAVNNLLGSIALQIVVIAMGDFVLGGRALSFVIGSPRVLLQGVFGAVLLSVLIVAIAIGDVPFLGAGAWSYGLFIMAVGLLWFVARAGGRVGWQPIGFPELGATIEQSGKPKSLRTGLLLTAMVAVIILVAGYLLARTGDAIAQQTGLGTSFIGLTLVGLATSLPEISTLIAAVRLRRYMMAFADIFGTNIINIALILLIDLAFPGGPVINEVGTFSQVAASLGILLTLLYVAGLIERRDETVGRLGLDSWAVILAYIGGLALLFTLR